MFFFKRHIKIAWSKQENMASLKHCIAKKSEYRPPLPLARTDISVETLQTICLAIGKQEQSESWMTELNNQVRFHKSTSLDSGPFLKGGG